MRCTSVADTRAQDTAHPPGHGGVPVDTLVGYERNAHRDWVDVVAEAFRRNGQYRPIIQSRTTSSQVGQLIGESLAGPPYLLGCMAPSRAAALSLMIMV